MKKSNPVWVLAIIIIFLLLVLNLVMFVRTNEYEEKLKSLQNGNVSFKGKVETGEKCPDAEGGLNESFVHIKYFYSKFCPWCIKEEPILQKLVKNYGNLIHIEWYNVNNCPGLVEEYKVSGVPTLVFKTVNNQTEYSHYGFVPEKDIMKLMCDVTGGC